MASGDLILSSGTVITAAEIQQIAAEVKKELAAESKELAEFGEVSSLTGVSSLPGIQQSGTTMKLVRVALSVLKGVDGKSVELTASSTAVQWRYVGETEWNTLVELSLLKGDKGAQGIQGTPGLPPVIEMGTVTTLLPDSDVTATLTPNGETAAGNPKYLLNLGVPAGRPGQDGDGAGNVFVNDAEGLQSGKLYLFQPGADGAVNGYFVEYVGQDGVGQKNPDYPGAELFNDYENNIAAGQYAHAEGRETNATGPRAHAEGYKTSVFAADAHAEGRNTWAMGAQSHTEGMYGIGWGSVSHTEGTVVVDFATGGSSYAILNDEELIRDFLNTCTVRYLPTENAEPYYWKITDEALAAYRLHGALGFATHAEGVNNIVCDAAGHVEGFGNICGDMIPGHEQDSSKYAPHVEGLVNKVASRLWAVHAGGGHNTIISGHYSFAHGYFLSVSNDFEVAFGCYNLSELDGKKVLFSYGVGNGLTGRKNALSILEDETVVIPILKSESMTREIDDAVAPISAKVNNNYNELKGITDEHTRQIADLLKLIQEGGGGGSTNAYVVGSTLVITSKLESSVDGEKLTITDSDASVTGEVLIIN